MTSTDAGAVQPYAPQTISGEVIQPTHVASAQANLGHQFINVLKHLVLHSGAYHDEGTQTAHLAVLSRYEEANSSAADRRHLLSEDDHAPREDVSQRTPPAGQAAVVPQAPALDYAALARAIVAVQQEQNKPADPPADQPKD